MCAIEKNSKCLTNPNICDPLYVTKTISLTEVSSFLFTLFMS